MYKEHAMFIFINNVVIIKKKHTTIVSEVEMAASKVVAILGN